jgi:hypothetical protein
MDISIEALHRFKNLSGEPRSGAHKYRIPIVDLALVDTVVTLAGCLVFAYLFDLSVWKTIVVVFSIAILTHALVGVQTKLTQYVGLVKSDDTPPAE